MCRPNLSYNGKAYVAFSDLCGFKQMMQNRRQAYEALNHMFNSAYDLLRTNDRVKALAVSDCVVSWAADHDLESIINFTADLHKKMIGERYLMQTAIAFDTFQYQDRIQLSNLQKALLQGGAYVTAFVEHENVIQGGIVLVRTRDNSSRSPHYNPDFWRVSTQPRGWEYFWSVDSAQSIGQIIQARDRWRTDRFEQLKDIYAAGRQMDLFWLSQ